MSDAAAADDAVTLDGEPSTQASWRDGLSEEFRDNPSLADIQDLDGLAKSFINAQRLVGVNKVELPGENATPDQLSDFHSQLGRPDSADGYQFEAPEGLPDGFNYDENLAGAFRESAFKAGLTPQQAKIVHDDYVKDVAQGVSEMLEADSKAVRDANTAIRKEWGDNYDNNVNETLRAIQFMGGPDFLNALKATGAMTADGAIKSAPMAFALHKVASLLTEDALPEGMKAQFTSSSADAAAEITRLKQDKDFMAAWTDSNHVGHAEAVAKMQDLQKARHGG